MNLVICVLLIVIAVVCIYMVSLPVIKENFVVSELKERLAVVDPKFKELDIREGASSFTEDKTIIYLCLRDTVGNYYPINTLVYVALHEIAHLMNRKDYGHTKAFYDVFDRLLCQAADKGVYSASIPHPEAYCGVDIRGITMPTCKFDDNDDHKEK